MDSGKLAPCAMSSSAREGALYELMSDLSFQLYWTQTYKNNIMNQRERQEWHVKPHVRCLPKKISLGIQCKADMYVYVVCLFIHESLFIYLFIY